MGVASGAQGFEPAPPSLPSNTFAIHAMLLIQNICASKTIYPLMFSENACSRPPQIQPHISLESLIFETNFEHEIYSMKFPL